MKATETENEPQGLADSGPMKSVIPVLIAYHDVPAAKWAMAVLQRIAGTSGNSIEFQPLPWSFNLLADPEGQALAGEDLMNCGILVVATSSVNPLPEIIQQWVDSAIGKKQGSGAMLVALFGREDHPEAIDSSRLLALKAAAQRAGLGFFAPTRRHAHEESFSDIHERASAITPLLDGILHLESREPGDATVCLA